MRPSGNHCFGGGEVEDMRILPHKNREQRLFFFFFPPVNGEITHAISSNLLWKMITFTSVSSLNLRMRDLRKEK